jgi:tRNA nucleotidyltransferase/poly(A) polymerase
MNNKLLNNIDPVAMNAIMVISHFVRNSDKYRNKAFIAGGFVRDLFLHTVSKDIDITVELENGGIDLANDLAEFLGIHTVVIFERFGTAMVPFSQITNIEKVCNIIGINPEEFKSIDIDIEFVQTRSETYTEENGRKPEVSFGTIDDDVLRRDFTVNALLLNLTTFEIMDKVGGIEDIRNGVIRTPNDPDMILTEDPLRILRAIRFSGRYGWKIEESLMKAIESKKHLLSTISRERVMEELNKMILGKTTLTKGSNVIYSYFLLNKIGLIPFMLGFSIDEKPIDIMMKLDITRLKMAFEMAVKSKSVSMFFWYALSHALSQKEVEEHMRTMKFDNDHIRLVSIIRNHGLSFIAAHKAASISNEILEELKRIKCVMHAMDMSKIHPLFGSKPTIYFDGNELMARFPDRKKGVWISDMTNIQMNAWQSTLETFGIVPTKEEVENILF